MPCQFVIFLRRPKINSMHAVLLGGRPILPSSWLGYRSGRPLSFWKVGASDLSVFGRSDAPTSQKLEGRSAPTSQFLKGRSVRPLSFFADHRYLPLTVYWSDLDHSRYLGSSKCVLECAKFPPPLWLQLFSWHEIAYGHKAIIMMHPQANKPR